MTIVQLQKYYFYFYTSVLGRNSNDSYSEPPLKLSFLPIIGYSWEALDVKLWDESSDYKLSDALRDLSDTIRIRGQYVGQSHYLDHIMVQEFVPHSLELRLYYIENKLVTRFWTKFDRVGAISF